MSPIKSTIMGCFVLLNPKFMVKRTKWPTSVLLNPRTEQLPRTEPKIDNDRYKTRSFTMKLLVL
jgi:hypothetical protein